MRRKARRRALWLFSTLPLLRAYDASSRRGDFRPTLPRARAHAHTHTHTHTHTDAHMHEHMHAGTQARTQSHTRGGGGEVGLHLKPTLDRLPPPPRACGNRWSSVSGSTPWRPRRCMPPAACRAAPAVRLRVRAPATPHGAAVCVDGALSCRIRMAWRSHACRSHGEHRSIGCTALIFCTPAPPPQCTVYLRGSTQQHGGATAAIGPGRVQPR